MKFAMTVTATVMAMVIIVIQLARVWHRIAVTESRMEQKPAMTLPATITLTVITVKLIAQEELDTAATA